MHEHPLPQRKPASAAALPSTTIAADWRGQANLLLLWLALLATLPRVVWGSVSVAAEHFNAFGVLSVPLRVVSVVSSIAVVVLVTQLKLLDDRPEGAPAAGLRRAAVAWLAVDVGWLLLRLVVLEFTTVPSFIWDSMVLRIALFEALPAVADIVFALWLARLLTTAKLQPFLPAVVWLSVAVTVFGNFFFWTTYLWAGVNFVVAVATLVEVLRVRRALA